MTEPATCQHHQQPASCPLIDWPTGGIVVTYTPETGRFAEPAAYRCKRCHACWKPDGTVFSAGS